MITILCHDLTTTPILLDLIFLSSLLCHISILKNIICVCNHVIFSVKDGILQRKSSYHLDILRFNVNLDLVLPFHRKFLSTIAAVTSQGRQKSNRPPGTKLVPRSTVLPNTWDRPQYSNPTKLGSTQCTEPPGQYNDMTVHTVVLYITL